MRTKAQRFRAAFIAGAGLLVVGSLAQAQTVAVAAAASEEAPARALAPLCDAPWFRSGSRVQMEGDGAMPMSITMTLRRATKNQTGCRAQLEVRSKSALSALMGPPVIMDQVHMVNIDRRSDSAKSSIESEHAVINAQGRYARMYGEAAFRGQGVFSYAGMDIREGGTLEGEAFESSVSLQIYPVGADKVVGSMRALYASISVGSRHVGKRQMIDTVLGRKECMPITYEKRTSLGPLMVGEEVVQVEPTLMHVTDWYCPAEAFVLRTEIRQQDKVQRIDVTGMDLDTTSP
ncbi:hypothetical protein [Cupriavidus basilensis]|uniref:hypothetical protein n=1 Tax=Cupriavidus basilensis TaxID=68895 RepID=UPI0005BDD338|nr:hypothetical protein [Cupriavidus basilensis]